MNYATRAIDWTEQGLVPDTVIRAGIRRLLQARLTELRADSIESVSMHTAAFIESMNASPIAPLAHLATTALRGAGRLLHARARPAA